MEVNLMDKLDIRIGSRLREIRERHRYKREHIAEFAGVSVDFLYDVENRQSNISVSKLFKICDALNTSPAYILSGAYSEAEEFMYLFNRLQPYQKTLAIKLLILLSNHPSP